MKYMLAHIHTHNCPPTHTTPHTHTHTHTHTLSLSLSLFLSVKLQLNRTNYDTYCQWLECKNNTKRKMLETLSITDLKDVKDAKPELGKRMWCKIMTFCDRRHIMELKNWFCSPKSALVARVRVVSTVSSRSGWHCLWDASEFTREQCAWQLWVL